MEKLETNIITPTRNSGKNADIIEDLEIMAQSIQKELNKKDTKIQTLENQVGDISFALDTINGEVI